MDYKLQREIASLNAVEHWIFDLDGTIADSKDAIVYSAMACYRDLDLPFKTPEEVASLIGRPGIELFKHSGVEDHVANNALHWFRSHLKENGGRLTHAFKGVGDLLQMLEFRGHDISLATNKSNDLAKQVLRDLDLLKYFGRISGTDNCRPKPFPDVISYCLQNSSKRVAAMIGDTPDDVKAGKAAGVVTVAVNHGTRPLDELEIAEPDYLFDSINEIVLSLSIK